MKSKNRITGGNPWNFEISIPEKYIMCDNEDIIQITLMNYSTYRGWYTLNTGYNTIAFKNMVSTVTTNIFSFRLFTGYDSSVNFESDFSSTGGSLGLQQK